MFVPNFAGVKLSTVKITPENKKLLETGYEARTDKVVRRPQLSFQILSPCAHFAAAHSMLWVHVQYASGAAAFLLQEQLR